MTDAWWKDASSAPPESAKWSYMPYEHPAPTLANLKDDFAATGAKLVAITSFDNPSYSDGGAVAFAWIENQANDLSDASGSSLDPSAFAAKCGVGKCCTGLASAAREPLAPGRRCRLNFINQDMKGLDDSIVEAIRLISVGSVFDVTAQASNDPSNAPDEAGTPVDATKFIQALRAMKEGDTASGCPSWATKDTDADGVDDTFVKLTVKVPVCFEVIPKTNSTVKPKPTAQFFNAFVDVLGMPGAVKLDRRVVVFLVPPRDIVAK